MRQGTDSDSNAISLLITRRYIGALSVIALLLILILVVFQILLARPLDNSRLITIATTQQTYSQKVMEAVEALIGDLGNPARDHAIRALHEALTDWEIAFTGIERGTASDLPSASSVQRYLADMRPHYQDIQAAGQCIVNLARAASGSGNPLIAAGCHSDIPSYADQVTSGATALLAARDAAVSEYEHDLTASINQLQQIVGMLLALALAALLLEGVFVFRPAVGQIQRTIVDLLYMQQKLRDSERISEVVGTLDAKSKQTEQALHQSQSRFRAFFEQAAVGIGQVAPDGTWLQLNPHFCDILGYSSDELVGRHFNGITHPDDRALSMNFLRELVSGERQSGDLEKRYIRKDGEVIWVHLTISVVRGSTGAVEHFIVVTEDITKHRKVEAEIRSRARQQATVSTLGQRALVGTDLVTLMNEVVALVAQTLDVEFSKILERLPDSNVLLLRAGVGWEEGTVGRATELITRENQAGYAVLSGEPVIVDDLRRDVRFPAPGILEAHGVVSGINVVIYGQDAPFGVLSAHTTRHRTFTENDLNFLHAVSNVLAAAIERKRAENAVQSAKEAAETASRAKTAFLANMSHELRTPLNSVIGMSQVLLMAAIGPMNERQTEYANDILVCGKHLLNLINDVLDLSRAESNRIQLVKAENSLAGVLFESLAMIRQRALAQELTIDTDINESLPPVCCDRQRVVQVVSNLLDNAIKYTPKGGRVTIRLYQDGRHARVAISDTGIGISPENQDRLFQPFERLEHLAHLRQYEGTGLGLALSKQLIELHHGTIGVTSEGEGQGATFWFMLPFSD